MSNLITSDPAPHIVTTAIPKAEYDATLRLARSLNDLHRYVQSFKSALRLFDFSRERQIASAQETAVKIQQLMSNPDPKAAREMIDESLIHSDWCNIACRDGAMTLYHFGKTLHNIRAALGECKTVNSMVEPAPLRHATKQFEGAFPDFEAMRHAIAHANELWKNVAKYLQNAIRGGYTKGNISISGGSALTSMLNNRHFAMTFEGRLVSYEMSEETLNKMVEIQNEYYSGFREAENKLGEAERNLAKT